MFNSFETARGFWFTYDKHRYFIPQSICCRLSSKTNFTVFPPCASLRSKIKWLIRLHTKKQPKFICVINLSSLHLDRIVGRVVSFHDAVISAVQELPSPDTVLNETLYLFFQRSSQPSDAWNPLILIFSASSLAFVFRIDADTTTFLLLTVKSHLKMRSSKFANVPRWSLLRFDLFPCALIDLKIFSLFLIQVDSVFFGMSYFIATWDFEILLQLPLKQRTFLWLILC